MELNKETFFIALVVIAGLSLIFVEYFLKT